MLSHNLKLIRPVALSLIIMTTALRAQSDVAGTLQSEAEAFFQAQNWAEAAKAFAKLTMQEPGYSQTWNRLGTAHLRLGKYQEAVAAYEKALTLSPNSPISKYNLACAFALLHDKEKAFAALRFVAETGFLSPQQLQNDDDLANLRDDARFAELLALAERRSHPCTSSPEYRQLDFWIGEWEVQSNGQLAGTNSVQLILGDCIIFENWSGVRGLTGKSFSLYDAKQHRWRQTWVDSRGGLNEFTGEFKGDRMEFRRTATDAEGQTRLIRMTLFNLGPDRVRQLSEYSTDEGKTWNVGYDFLYLRKK